MKYCKNCGTSIDDDVVFCPNCGQSTLSNNATQTQVNATYSNNEPEESNIMGILSIVFGALGLFIPIMSIVGIVMSAIGLKKLQQQQNKTLCKIGLIISIIVTVLNAIVILISIIMMVAILSSGLAVV